MNDDDEDCIGVFQGVSGYLWANWDIDEEQLTWRPRPFRFVIGGGGGDWCWRLVWILMVVVDVGALVR